MTRRVEGGVTHTQTFDVENRLTAVKVLTGTVSIVAPRFLSFSLMRP
jgi:hypothetical protein